MPRCCRDTTTLLLVLVAATCGNDEEGCKAPASDAVEAGIGDAAVVDALDDAPDAAPLTFTKGVSTVAGSGVEGFADGLANRAQLSYPTDVAVDRLGRLYIADSGNHRIRVVEAGRVTTLAGGSSGFRDGSVRSASFSSPEGIAIAEGEGRVLVYVADRDNHAVRVIDEDNVDTVAGDGEAGFVDGARGTARFNEPRAVCVSADGKLYVADSANRRVRVISDDRVETLAGSGDEAHRDGLAATAAFLLPVAIVSSSEKVYVADQGGNRVRSFDGLRVATHVGSGLPGSDDGFGRSASFDGLSGLAVLSDVLYIADTNNHRLRVVQNGRVSTVVGDGIAGDGDGLFGRLNAPAGLAIGPHGEVYIADRDNHSVRVFVR